MATSVARLVLVLCLGVAGLGACAPMSYNMGEVVVRLDEPGTGAIGVTVQDRREAVVSGKKGERWLGTMRGELGARYDLKTSLLTTLADAWADVVCDALTSAGYRPARVRAAPIDPDEQVRQALAASGGRANMLFVINRWQSDTDSRTVLEYDVTLTLLSPEGESLAAAHLSGIDDIGFAGLNRVAWNKEHVPERVKVRLQQLINDREIARALRQN